METEKQEDNVPMKETGMSLLRLVMRFKQKVEMETKYRVGLGFEQNVKMEIV